MENEVMYMSTIYGPTGLRVAFELDAQLEKVAERAPVTAKNYGPRYTFKLWICTQIPVTKKP